MRKSISGISNKSNFILNLVFIIYSFLCIAPLLLVIAVSITDEKTIYANGYSFLPQNLSLDAYKFIFTNSDKVFRAYGVSFLVTIVGSILSFMVTSMLAYPISRSDFKYRNKFMFYVFFTMLFSGGFVPWYIICVQFLHLKDTIWALMLPYLVNAWYVIILKTYYQSSVPLSVLESARIDGAGELRTFITIVTPLSIPGIATIVLFTTLTYWNDWWLPLTLINNESLYNLQYLMYKVQLNVESLKLEPRNMSASSAKELMQLPTETARMAMCIVGIGPIVMAYPFFQKYFVKGLTVGAIKG